MDFYRSNFDELAPIESWHSQPSNDANFAKFEAILKRFLGAFFNENKKCINLIRELLKMHQIQNAPSNRVNSASNLTILASLES